MDVSSLCMGCMETTGAAPACPKCGYKAGSAAESPLYLAPGSVLKNQYVVGKVLGHGGFGITYLGYDTLLDSKVAIKEYFPSGVAIRTGSDPAVFAYSGTMKAHYEMGLERFLDEARTVRKFREHANIVHVENFFPENGTAYMVLEYLDGITFLKFLERRGGRTDWATTLRIVMPVMDALREVHRSNFLHRDVSPDNIYLLRSGMVKLIDFGAARQALGHASQNMSMVFKGGYTPPEQYQERGRQGPWTDVYATASTIYRALTGQMPPPAPDRLAKVEMAPPRAMGADIPEAQEQALLQALSLEPEQRFQKIEAFQAALRGDVKAPPPLPSPGPQPAPQPVPPHPVKWPKWLLPAGVFAALLLAMAVWRPWTKPTGPPVDPKPPIVAAQPRITEFSLDPSRIRAGETMRVTWATENAERVLIAGQDVPKSGSVNLTPKQSGNITIMAVNADGSQDSKTLPFEVASGGPPPKPGPDPGPGPGPGPTPRQPIQVVYFLFDPPSVVVDRVTTLKWQVTGATRVTIQGLGDVPAQGERAFRISRPTYARLTAEGPAGSTTATATVSVTPNPPGPDPGPGPGPTPNPDPTPTGGMTWTVFHDHGAKSIGTNILNVCRGVLTLRGDTLNYSTRENPDDAFRVKLSSLEKVDVNSPLRTMSGRRTFQVKVRGGRNYNFMAPDAAAADVVAAIREAMLTKR